MLSERGRRPLDGGGGAGELDRESELADLAETGLLVGDRHLALAHELGLERLVELEDRLDHRVVLVVEGSPLLTGPRPEDLGDLAVRVRSVPLELLLDQVLPSHAAAEGLPELRLERAAADPAVLRLVGPVADEPTREHQLAATWDLAGGEVPGGLHRQPGERAVRHRDVHDLALAAPARLVKGGQDPDRSHQRAAAEVGELDAGLDRRPAGLAGQTQDPVQAQIVHVVPGPVAVRPVLAVAGDRAVDQRRIRLAQNLVADAEPLEDAWPEALDHDVGRLRQLQQRLPAPLLLQVQADRALVAVQREVQGRAGSQRSCARPSRSRAAPSAGSRRSPCPPP